jgi:hypothetical protein
MKSGQSLQEQLHSLLPQGTNETDNKNKIIQTSVLKIIHNTVVFDDTVYQVRNISVVELSDLTRTFSINQSVPRWYWYLLVLGIVLIPFGGLGIFLLAYVGYLFWKHTKLEKSRTVEKYGLRISMNSGEAVILTSSSRDFVLKIILTLYEIMNTDTPRALAFNFETLKVEDRSINIEQAYGSAVVSGQVTGNIVNNI